MSELVKDLDLLAKMDSEEDPDTPIEQFVTYRAARAIELAEKENAELREKNTALLDATVDSIISEFDNAPEDMAWDGVHPIFQMAIRHDSYKERLDKNLDVIKELKQENADGRCWLIQTERKKNALAAHVERVNEFLLNTVEPALVLAKEDYPTSAKAGCDLTDLKAIMSETPK